MRTVLPDLSGRSSLTGIGHDVRICIWKHSLQRRLPSEMRFMLPHSRVTVLGEVFICAYIWNPERQIVSTTGL